MRKQGAWRSLLMSMKEKKIGISHILVNYVPHLKKIHFVITACFTSGLHKLIRTKITLFQCQTADPSLQMSLVYEQNHVLLTSRRHGPSQILVCLKPFLNPFENRTYSLEITDAYSDDEMSSLNIPQFRLHCDVRTLGARTQCKMQVINESLSRHGTLIANNKV